MTSAWNAGLYEDQHSFVWKFGADLVPMVAPQPGEWILDAGCGTGQLTARLAESGAHVVGVDQSEEMIARARANYPGVQFEVGDIRRYHPVRKYDAVFSNAVLHWVHEAEEAAGSFARALRPGGRFVAEFGGKGNVALLLEGVRSAGRELGFDLNNPWFFPSVAEYAVILEKRGLEVRQAALFDRPTRLDDLDHAIEQWIRMFGASWLAAIPESAHADFFRLAEGALRPTLFRDGAWWVDYRRLRVLAVRKE